MPLKFTGGGSLTFSVAVLVAAWTIRALRDKRRRSSSTAAPAEGSAKYLSELSLEALSLLVGGWERSFIVANTLLHMPATVQGPNSPLLLLLPTPHAQRSIWRRYPTASSMCAQQRWQKQLLWLPGCHQQSTYQVR
jgi:hypothetical protein